MSKAASVFVATPTVAGVVKRRTTVSLYDMAMHLAARGIGSKLITTDSSNVCEARDLLAAQFLQSSASHLLFVDSDMEFDAADAAALLDANRPVVGAAYPQRMFNFGKMREAMQAGETFDAAYARAHTFTFAADEIVRTSDGLLKVDALGTGFMLIERSVFEMLSGRMPLRRYDFYGNSLVGFFDRVQIEEKILPEDLSFCHRWKSIGGEMFVQPNLNVRHIGEISLGFPLATFLKS